MAGYEHAEPAGRKPADYLDWWCMNWFSFPIDEPIENVPPALRSRFEAMQRMAAEIEEEEEN